MQINAYDRTMKFTNGMKPKKKTTRFIACVKNWQKNGNVL